MNTTAVRRQFGYNLKPKPRIRAATARGQAPITFSDLQSLLIGLFVVSLVSGGLGILAMKMGGASMVGLAGIIGTVAELIYFICWFRAGYNRQIKGE